MRFMSLLVMSNTHIRSILMLSFSGFVSGFLIGGSLVRTDVLEVTNDG